MDGVLDVDAGRPTVAVLPFAIAGAGGDDVLIASGLHEDICGELTRFRTLRVISPGSAGVVADWPIPRSARGWAPATFCAAGCAGSATGCCLPRR
jgi:TolB-like protein